MKLSACLIMKDAAKDLEDCLESLKEGVDEIVVVDTGSKDKSVEIARRYTDKVYFFQWRNDFAAARNCCLDHATGDWIFFPDADEYLTRETRGNLHHVARMMDEQGYDVVLVPLRNVDEDYVPMDMVEGLVPRLFRSDPSRRYVDPVHEHISCSGEKEEKRAILSRDLLLLDHKGYSPSRSRQKHVRNLRLLEAMRDGGREKPYLDYYLAQSYFQEEDYVKAIHHARQAIRKNDLPVTDLFGPWRYWILSQEKMGISFEEREEAIRLAMAAGPKVPEFQADYGALLANRGDFQGAWEYLRRAEGLMGEFRENFAMQEDWLALNLEGLYHVLSVVGLQTGHEEEARRYALLAWEAKLGREDDGCRRWIPPKSRSVLEFACGCGESGVAFRRVQSGCRYVGADTEGVRIAEGRLSEVIHATPETLDFSARGLENLDCMIYPDRALRDLTTKSLCRNLEHLSPEGQVIFLLENMGYFPYGMKVLAGKADNRQRSGLSMEELRRLIGGADLTILSEEAVASKEDGKEKEREETKALLDAFSRWCKSAKTSAEVDPWAVRYVVRAARKKPEREMFLQALEGDPLISGRVRVEEPLQFLGTVPGVSCRICHGDLEESHGEKVLLLQKLQSDSVEHALRQLDAIRREGYLCIYEMDEHPFLRKDGYERSAFLDLIGAHVIQTSTPALADALREYNPHVKVFRNEMGEVPPRRKLDGSSGVNIFFGAWNREAEGQELLPILNEVIREHGEEIRFTVLSDVDFFRGLETERKEFIGRDAYCGGRFVPYSVYRSALSSADIALLPLRDTPFHRMKSDLKFIESAACGAAVLASPVVYGDAVRDGETGFLFRDGREFRRKLMLLIRDGNLRCRMADAAYDYVRRERMLSQHYEERLAWYLEMLDRREELDRDLAKRLEGLGR